MIDLGSRLTVDARLLGLDAHEWRQRSYMWYGNNPMHIHGLKELGNVRMIQMEMIND